MLVAQFCQFLVGYFVRRCYTLDCSVRHLLSWLPGGFCALFRSLIAFSTDRVLIGRLYDVTTAGHLAIGRKRHLNQAAQNCTVPIYRCSAYKPESEDAVMGKAQGAACSALPSGPSPAWGVTIDI